MQIFVCLPHGSRHGNVAVQIEPLQNLGHLKSMLLPGQTQSVLDALYISCRGRTLQDKFRLADCGISDCSMVELRVRALGGGGDGGATGAESRDCYLNMYATKKPDKVDPNEARLAKWCRCTLSSEALKPPCVVDLLGNLYNKEALVSALLEKNLPKELRHIKGLKDMITIHPSLIPGISPDEETSSAKFQCPISGQEFNGKYRFFALRGCGHVLSAKALKEVQTYSCLVCHAPFNETDKIVINGTDDEVKLMRQKIEDQRIKARDKKEKKVRNGQYEETKEVLVSHEAEKVEVVNGEQKSFSSGVKRKGDVNGLHLKAPEDVAVKSKRSDSVHELKKFKAADHLPPNATKEVYASIFTSSSKKSFKETYSCRSLPIGRN